MENTKCSFPHLLSTTSPKFTRRLVCGKCPTPRQDSPTCLCAQEAAQLGQQPIREHLLCLFYLQCKQHLGCSFARPPSICSGKSIRPGCGFQARSQAMKAQEALCSGFWILPLASPCRKKKKEILWPLLLLHFLCLFTLLLNRYSPRKKRGRLLAYMLSFPAHSTALNNSSLGNITVSQSSLDEKRSQQ